MSALLAVLVLAQPVVTVSHRKLVTEDGAALALYRYQPLVTKRGLPPVLLIADLGFGRALFDFEGEGLAWWLVAHGREVYVAELRGQGAADATHSLRTAVELDLPALARALPGPVDLVAHGYLGTLVLASRALQLRRVVAIATPLEPDAPSTLQHDFLSGGADFATLSASPAGFDRFEQLFAMGSRGDHHVLAAFAANGTRTLGPGASRELLAWLQSGDLPLDDGSTVRARLAGWATPTLVLLGLADAWAPPESCVGWRAVAAPGAVRLRTFSRFTDGDDYAHVSILVGHYARRWVFPELGAFLDDADPR